jgi:sec-independent protein translocase protein TatB
MLDVGFSEILLTSAIALIVLGPERLPKVARQVGNWMGRARAMARQLSEQLEREVSAEEFLKAQSKPSQDPPGAAFDPSHSATLAPATVSTPPPAAATPASAETVAASPAAVNTSSPVDASSPTDAPGSAAPTPAAAPVPAPEPVYGLPADLTTPAAMHGADPPGTHPTHE